MLKRPIKPLKTDLAASATSLLAIAALTCACNRCPANSAAGLDTTPSSARRPSEIKVDQDTGATNPVSLGISGLVSQPMTLRQEELESYQSASVRLNDVHRDGGFHGVHVYRGVPLRVLLEQAQVEKKESVFDRDIDLAVAVRSRGGQQAMLSWGEIFYGNPADVIVAYSGAPKMPHKTCDSCHEKEVYEDWLGQLERKVVFPKLVIARDQWSDRCIENIADIEVVDIGREVGVFLEKEKRPEKLYSTKIEINGSGIGPIGVDSIEGFRRFEAEVIQAGDGTGFHGIRRYEGVSLAEVLLKAGIEPDAASALVCSAPDGYRMLLSAGEVFLSPSGERIMLADTLDGKPIEDGGKFRIVPTSDFAADRWLKSVTRIDIVTAPSGSKP